MAFIYITCPCRPIFKAHNSIFIKLTPGNEFFSEISGIGSFFNLL